MPQFTISIFRRLLDDAPPLFPAESLEKARAILARLESGADAESAANERAMIKFGGEIWPWREAHGEFLTEAEERLAEHFFPPLLSEATREKYLSYRECEAPWRDFYSGRLAEYFTPEERVELSAALNEARRAVRDFVAREIAGLGQEKYLARVSALGETLEKIKFHLSELEKLADEETSHPSLADEIRAKVRAFEEGLCSLGPSFSPEEIAQAREFFLERKSHLNRMRGIDEATEVDFYS